MIDHILVPLDGSKLAEAAIPPVIQLATALQAGVKLIHVIEADAPETVHGERHLRDEQSACMYLTEQAERFPKETEVECHVHTEEVKHVAQSIASHADEMHSELIVMCAHGQGGWGERVVGSIAQQVIAVGRTPVLLLQMGEKETAREVQFRSLLVALDSNPEHEGGFQLAAEIGPKLKARINLVHVVPTMATLSGSPAAAGRLLPASASAMLDMSEAVAEKYLEGKAEPLRKSGLLVETLVLRGDPAEMVVKAGKVLSADIIVVGTHGKAGFEAFWQGSVAARIIAKSKLPILLAPVEKH